MKNSKGKKIASKGDRLNWTPIKDVKPFKLSPEDLSGRRLTNADLKSMQPGYTGKLILP